MNRNADRLIYTCQPDSADYAANELLAAGLGKTKLLAPGVGLLAPEGGFDRAAALLSARPPLFVRHICPAHLELSPDKASDGDALSEAAAALAPLIEARASFSVQAAVHGLPTRPAELAHRLLASPSLAGVTVEPSRPADVLSAVLTPGGLFLGLSRAADNLSPWPGGARRFAAEEGRVSRAEFKLLEALELFPFEVDPGARALDLGAAPGGWTRVLRSRGARVTAVDPAELDSAVAADPAVTHYKGLSQSFLAENPGARFDLLVNDMRMDALESVRVTLSALPVLEPGARMLVTLKLPEKNGAKAAGRALGLFGASADLLFARQLFHNRSELTVLAAKRGE